jgi:hypothetical protein
MARVATSNLGLGTFADGENPGAGSQSIRSTGLNDLPIALDIAVGGEHNADGTHKANKIDKGNLKTTVCDGASTEKDASVGIRVKALGILSGMLAAASVIAGKLCQSGAGKVADLVTIGFNASNELEVKDAGISSVKLGYKEYVALLSQNYTEAPTVIVLKSTLSGTIVWTRASAGLYYGTLSGEFAENKTFVQVTPGEILGIFCGDRLDSDRLRIVTINYLGASSDLLLSNSSIVIRVYP